MERILVVDDDHDLRLTIVDALQSSGFLVDEASNGNEAIDKLRASRFDIAIIDMVMPRLTGLELLSEIKKISPRTKIIIMTAFATIDNAVEAIKRGASDYVKKPFRLWELLSIVNRTIEEKKFEEGTKKMDIDRAFASLSSSIRRSILNMLSSCSGMKLSEITENLKIADSTKVSYHLRMLIDSGLIIQDNRKRYCLSPKGEKVIESLKIINDYLSFDEITNHSNDKDK